MLNQSEIKNNYHVNKLLYISLLIWGIRRASLRISNSPWRNKEIYCFCVLRIIIHSTSCIIYSAFIVFFIPALSVLRNSFFASISLFVFCPRTVHRVLHKLKRDYLKTTSDYQEKQKESNFKGKKIAFTVALNTY